MSAKLDIDVDALRAHLADRLGTAAFGGFPAVMMDLWDVESASPDALVRKALSLGIDIAPFKTKKA